MKKIFNEFKKSTTFNSITLLNTSLLIIALFAIDGALIDKLTFFVLFFTLIAVLAYTIETRKMSGATLKMANVTQDSLNLEKARREKEEFERISNIEKGKRKLVSDLLTEIQENRRKAVYIDKRPGYRFTGFYNVYERKIFYSEHVASIFTKDQKLIDSICELYSSFDHANIVARMLTECEANLVASAGGNFKEKYDKINNFLKTLIKTRIFGEEEPMNIDQIIKKLEDLFKRL
ncbi:MAG: hypothetical protein PHV17_04540 [Candidatus Omnitrophica bacterium]|nr:hypothetical protein [Candidatus Omnitrophota bacterium]